MRKLCKTDHIKVPLLNKSQHEAADHTPPRIINEKSKNDLS
jgi:hypothetical protein